MLKNNVFNSTLKKYFLIYFDKIKYCEIDFPNCELKCIIYMRFIKVKAIEMSRDKSYMKNV